MLANNTTTAPKRAALPEVTKSRTRKAASTNPAPIMVAKLGTDSKFPPVIFGDVPKKFSIAGAAMSDLARWHRTAVDAARAIPNEQCDDNPTFEALNEAKWSLFEEAFRADVANVNDLADLMNIAALHAKDCNDSAVLIEADRIRSIGEKIATLGGRDPSSNASDANAYDEAAHARLRDLESPIIDAKVAVSIVATLAGQFGSNVANYRKAPAMTAARMAEELEEDIEQILFIAYKADQMLGELCEQYLAPLEGDAVGGSR